MTEIGVQITGVPKGRPHKNSIFENNIITNAPVISQASGDLKGILFRNNLWDEQPYAAMRGSGWTDWQSQPRQTESRNQRDSFL